MEAEKTLELEYLTQIYESQIELALDTLVAIQDREKEVWPTRHLWDWHQKATAMMFTFVLIRHLWDNTTALTSEERLEAVHKNSTLLHEFLLKTYWFDTKKPLSEK